MRLSSRQKYREMNSVVFRAIGVTQQDGNIVAGFFVKFGDSFKGFQTTQAEIKLSIESAVLGLNGWYPKEGNSNREPVGQTTIVLGPGIMGNTAGQYQRNRMRFNKLLIDTTLEERENVQTVQWIYKFDPLHDNLYRLEFVIILLPHQQADHPDEFAPFTVRMTDIAIHIPSRKVKGRFLEQVLICDDPYEVQVDKLHLEQNAIDTFRKCRDQNWQCCLDLFP